MHKNETPSRQNEKTKNYTHNQSKLFVEQNGKLKIIAIVFRD